MNRSLQKKKHKLAQGTVEYLIITSVVLGAILATGFLGKIRHAFEGYFDSAVEQIVPPTNEE